MNTQILTKPAQIYNLVISLPPTNISPTQPIQAVSYDYGFDLDVEALTPWPATPPTQPALKVGAAEFESCYHWYIS